MVHRTLVPVRRRKGERPRELLEAALALFIEQGFAATRIDEIAERAGVSKGTLYLYFDHKQDLFADLMASRFFCRYPLEGACADEMTGSGLLRAVAAGWHESLAEASLGGVVKLVFTEIHHFPALADFWVNTVMAPTRAWVREAIRRGADGAEFRATEPDVVMNVLVLPIVASCLHRQVIESRAPCPVVSTERSFIERHVEGVVHALSIEHA